MVYNVVRFAGNALTADITTAFVHLETAPVDHPSLTILCWDSASTHSPVPHIPWSPNAYIATGPNDAAAKGYIKGYNTDTIITVHQLGSDILRLYDRSTHTALFYIKSLQAIFYHQHIRDILHWWCKSLPLQLVHAGAVGTPEGGVLLTGKGGSGKSTTALACFMSPLDYIGDDYVLITSAPTPYVYSLYQTARLNSKSLEMLPDLAKTISNPNRPDDEKAQLLLHDHFPEKLRQAMPIKALFLPRVTFKKNTRLIPATSVEALFSIAPTSVMYMSIDRKIAFEKMRALAHAVPSFWLELGTDLKQIPLVIADYLEQAT